MTESNVRAEFVRIGGPDAGRQFDALSSQDKVNIIRDLETESDLARHVSFGKPALETKSDSVGVFRAAPTVNREHTMRIPVTLWKIKVVVYRQTFAYSIRGRDVVAKHLCEGNWTGFTGLLNMQTKPTAWISTDGNATCNVDTSVDFVFKGLHTHINKRGRIVIREGRTYESLENI